MNAATQPPVLGVTCSLGGRTWRHRCTDERQAMALSQRHGLPDIVGRILIARGIDDGQVESYLDPRLRDLMPDPSHFLDMDRAVERTVSALRGGEKIAVFGDYDVDGATSSALLQRYFRALGTDISVYIPDRLKEGYGPNAAAFDLLKRQGVGLVITVDCGATAFDALAHARKIGLDVIVLDHHKGDAALPEAVAVVNPNRVDEDTAHRQLAAVGVVFMFLVALNRALRLGGYFSGQAGRQEPDLRQWLDIVALGTVCDVVPLTGVNRALVVQGLKVMRGRRNPGLRLLGDVAGIKEPPGTYHLGFVLGPRVNAGGRVGEAGLGARLLSTEDEAEAERIARRLHDYNRERQQIEAAVLDEAIAQSESRLEDNTSLAALTVASAGWHPGVIGIVASRLKEKFSRPAFVIALEDGVGKGSGRSVPGIDLGAIVTAARQAGLLINGGGHAMAAGLTVAEEKLGAFRAFFEERTARALAGTAAEARLGIDGLLAPGAANDDMLALIDRLGPFGAGNPEPRFVVPDVVVQYADIVGENHIRVTLRGGDGKRLQAIAFRAVGESWGTRLLQRNSAPVHVAGYLRVNFWQGQRRVQFIIQDVAEPQPQGMAGEG